MYFKIISYNFPYIQVVCREKFRFIFRLSSYRKTSILPDFYEDLYFNGMLVLMKYKETDINLNLSLFIQTSRLKYDANI